MKNPRLPFLILLCAVVVALCPSAAQANVVPGLFTHPPETDIAIGWMDFLFRGIAPSEALGIKSENFASLIAALHEGLRFYGMGMLILAGVILLYQITSLIAETAHQGVIMGKTANQIWTPIRLVLAIGLLLPLGGGLSVGQGALVRFAEAGSMLASNTWGMMTESVKPMFVQLTPPQLPNISELAMAAIEMESCKGLYRQAYATFGADPAVKAAGDIFVSTHIPSDRLMPETWRYTNILHRDAPLCGEFRFLLPEDNKIMVALTRDNKDLRSVMATFSRSFAEQIVAQVPLLTGTSSEATALSQDNNIHSFVIAQQDGLNDKIKLYLSNMMRTLEKSVAHESEKGWLAAGLLPLEIVRTQFILGQASDRALPDVSRPLLGHKVVAKPFIEEAISNMPSFKGLDTTKVYDFYAHLNKSVRLMRQDFYAKSAFDQDVVPDKFDIEDKLSATTPDASASYLATKVIRAAAYSDGLWLELDEHADTNRQEERGLSLYEMKPDASPLASLVEGGRRLLSFGFTVLSTATPFINNSSTLLLGIFVGFVGILSVGLSVFLILSVSIIPFFRFFMAAFAWVLAVCEAILTMPFIALAHLTPKGEGLSGPLARRAYWLWLCVFLRPLLSLFGFLIGWMLIGFSLAFLPPIFTSLMQGGIGQNDLLISYRLTLVLTESLLFALLSVVAFKGVNRFPDALLSWLGTIIVGEATSEASIPPQQMPSQITSSVPASSATAMLDGKGRRGASGAQTTSSARSKAEDAFFPQAPERGTETSATHVVSVLDKGTRDAPQKAERDRAETSPLHTQFVKTDSAVLMPPTQKEVRTGAKVPTAAEILQALSSLEGAKAHEIALKEDKLDKVEKKKEDPDKDAEEQEDIKKEAPDQEPPSSPE